MLLENLSSIDTKTARLKEDLSKLGPTCTLVSGGVDSSLMAFLAHNAHPESISAIAVSDSLYGESLDVARLVSGYIGMRLLEVPSSETQDPNYLENSPNRCAVCRQISVAEIKEAVSDNYILLSGINDDDRGELPGISAMTKLQVRHPLQEAGIGKFEIKQLAREAGLPNWNRPSMACLSSNVPRGIPISADQLVRLGQGLKSVHDALPWTREFITRVREPKSGLAFVAFEKRALNLLTPDDKNRIVTVLLRHGHYKQVQIGLYEHGQMNS